jgi:hypothetical protein
MDSTIRQQVLDFIKDIPLPSFFVAHELKKPYQDVKICLEQLHREGSVKNFEVSLLGIKEQMYFVN